MNDPRPPTDAEKIEHYKDWAKFWRAATVGAVVMNFVPGWAGLGLAVLITVLLGAT